jgi:ABC-type glycerol-3-phosphate transport system substrate-binding protein
VVPISAEQFVYTAPELARLADHLADEFDLQPYDIPTMDGVVSGISLLELLPLMEYVYDMRIVTAAGEIMVDVDAPENEWGEIFLLPEAGGSALLLRGERHEAIREIRFQGERLEPGHLEIWLGWEGNSELKRDMGNFALRHGIELDAETVPSPDTKLTAVVRARGPLPDLVMIQSSGLATLVEARAIQPLDYLDFPRLVSQGHDAFSLNGHLWAMPFYFDTQVVFYNRELLPAIPVNDWTLERMEAMARGLRDEDADQTGGRQRGPEIHPMVWNAYSSNWLIPFQISFGKDRLVEEDGRIQVDDLPTLEALRYLLRLQDEGLLVPMERDGMDALFVAGQVGMILSGSYAIPYFESLGLTFGVLPYPVNQETGRAVSSLLDFKAFVMTRQTRHPVLARRMLEYLYGPGVQLRFCADLRKLSVRDDLRLLAAGRSEYGEMLERTVASGTVIPPDRVYSVYKNNMWKLLRFALSRQMSPEETLRAGQRLMDAER